MTKQQQQSLNTLAWQIRRSYATRFGLKVSEVSWKTCFSQARFLMELDEKNRKARRKAMRNYLIAAGVCFLCALILTGQMLGIWFGF